MHKNSDNTFPDAVWFNEIFLIRIMIAKAKSYPYMQKNNKERNNRN